MNDRERRDFNAGLSEEVDAWLRGDNCPAANFLTKLVLMGGAAMLPGFGYTASTPKAWADAADISKVDLAAPDTPLGHAQADAVRASTEGPQTGRPIAPWRRRSSSRAASVTMTYEAGLQALEPRISPARCGRISPVFRPTWSS